MSRDRITAVAGQEKGRERAGQDRALQGRGRAAARAAAGQGALDATFIIVLFCFPYLLKKGTFGTHKKSG